jgi:hypothetical protein
MNDNDIFTEMPIYFSNIPSKIMATVSEDGEVFINWVIAEKEAQNKDSPLCAYAKLIIAVRDGTWKPL